MSFLSFFTLLRFETKAIVNFRHDGLDVGLLCKSCDG